MGIWLQITWIWFCNLFKSERRLEAENLALRHQLNIAMRRMPGKPRLTGVDRALFVWLYRRCPDALTNMTIVRPETIVRWHRMGFRAFWYWKSRNLGGRPKIDRELGDLIRRMCKENPLWGAPRIHGELLKLGFNVAQSTVSKYMPRRRGPPSQGWRTFLRNHADGIAAVDFLVVPTLRFERLFAFVILGLGRRRTLWIGVTTNPTAEWLANQITQAFPWDTAPTYLIRDNDGAYGVLFTRRVRAMGIRDRPITPRSPWQNGYVERVIGSIRRDCLDHVVFFSASHLRRVLTTYADYYNSVRTHLGIAKDTPIHRPLEAAGRIIAKPILGGLHHQYARI